MSLERIAKDALVHCQGRHTAMLQLTEALVATASHSDDLRGVGLCFDVLDAGLRALGFEVARPEAPEGRPHLLATRPGADPKAPTVLCLGHVDTIFDRDYPGGSFGVHGTRALGPGVADMKSGLVVMVTALEALAETNSLDTFRFRVLVTSDKEQGAEGSRELIRRIAAEADVALVFGPAGPDGGVIRSRSGTGRFEIKVRGVPASVEAQSPDGRNAIVELAHLVPALEDLNDRHRGIILNCGIVSGGVRTGVVPAEATLAIEVWCDGPTDQRWVHGQLTALAARASCGATETTITGGFTRPPWPPSARTDALVEAWSHAARLVGLDVGAAEHSNAASDGNLSHGASVPTLDGLGARGGDLRTSDEWVAVDELPVRAAIAAAGLLAWYADQEGGVTWRVGGIIQGETPDDGEVQVSEAEIDETMPETLELDRTDDALDLAGLHDEADVFAAPGEMDVVTDDEVLEISDATDEEG